MNTSSAAGNTGLQLTDVHVTYRGHPPVRAVDGVSLAVAPGQVVGLVGGSGCGKSTLARAVCGITTPESGTITFDGAPVTPLHPRRPIGMQIAEGTRAAERRGISGTSSTDWLARVGLEADASRRYPHEFSGGQRQRIAIARALAAAADDVSYPLEPVLHAAPAG